MKVSHVKRLFWIVWHLFWVALIFQLACIVGALISPPDPFMYYVYSVPLVVIGIGTYVVWCRRRERKSRHTRQTG